MKIRESKITLTKAEQEAFRKCLKQGIINQLHSDGLLNDAQQNILLRTLKK